MSYNSKHDNFCDRYLIKPSILLLTLNYTFYDIKLKIFFAPKLEMILLFLQGINAQMPITFLSKN